MRARRWISIGLALLAWVGACANPEGDQGRRIAEGVADGNSLLTVRDIEGNRYRVARLGAHLWLRDNLSVTRSPQGAPLAWHAPNNDATQIAEFGRLYDWDSARLACPLGWRLPTDADWSMLEVSLGDTHATDPDGFATRPAGYWNGEGLETRFGATAVFWTATPHGDHLAWSRVINMQDRALRRATQHPEYGFSVRCVTDAPSANR